MIVESAEVGQALALVERLQNRMHSRSFPGVGRVTVSLGVAVHQPGESRSDLLRRADEALYAAKRQGRNRVVLSIPREA